MPKTPGYLQYPECTSLNTPTIRALPARAPEYLAPKLSPRVFNYKSRQPFKPTCEPLKCSICIATWRYLADKNH